MAVSKVILNGNTLIDTTQKTVTASKMLSGETALNNAGEDITGNIATKTSSNMTVSGATVTAQAGYYASNASKSVATGTAGTPTATKGTVSNHSVTVTPSVTNTTGYISGGTKTGTAVTVSARELVSGTTLYCDESGSWNVANAETFVVDAGTVNNPTATKGTVSNHAVTVTPSVSHVAGWISSGTKTGTPVTVSASELVSGTKTIDENGTSIDVTNYSSVDVNVSGGSTARLIYEGILTNTSTSSTTEALAETIDLGTTDAWTYDKILYITIQKITDWNVSGTRPSSNEEMGSETFCLGPGAWAERYDDGSTTYAFPSREVQSYYYANSRFYVDSGGIRGVYPKSLTKAGALSIYKRKASTGYTFDVSGTFKIWVYLLDYPEGSPFVERT